MPSILRSRLALFALLGAFLIPIGMSSLRGLTHVLTCSERAETPFSLLIPEQGDPIVTTSSRLVRGENPQGLCGGLELTMGARVLGSGKVAMVLPIKNNSKHPWRGSVELVIQGTSIPVDIGEIGAGEKARDTVEFELPPGTHEVNGSLLIGP